MRSQDADNNHTDHPPSSTGGCSGNSGREVRALNRAQEGPYCGPEAADESANVSDVNPSSTPGRGARYVTAEGTVAVKGGLRRSQHVNEPDIGPKPHWLRVKLPSGHGFEKVRNIVHEGRLPTVCAESKCPNMAECWGRGTATLMLMGEVCTRACRFCSVSTGNPNGWLDPLEPARVAAAVVAMGLRYVVLTSVDRDDLVDGGANHYAACIRAIHNAAPEVAVEVLTPDFLGRTKDVAIVLNAGLVTFAQNIETVKRLTNEVRDRRAGYEQTLRVLAFAKDYAPTAVIKSSLMLGLGETDSEVEQTLRDLRLAGVEVVTMGQYLRPSPHHLPVRRYVTPAEFTRYRDQALRMGFLEVVSGPLVRSSYRAERVLDLNNAGLGDAARLDSPMSSTG